MFQIKYRDAKRDHEQSKFGMGTSAEDGINARPNLKSYGLNSVQTAGGTTKDLSRRNGYDQWEYSATINKAYTDVPIPQTSLWRNVCGYYYNPQAHGVLVDLLVEELIEFQGTQTPYYLPDVFEGMNAFAPMEDMAGVLKEANEIIKAEYGDNAVLARARGTLCIDDKRDTDGNPILDVDELVKHAGKLLDLGYEGIYIKSASGRVDPNFIGELADKIYEAHGHRMTLEMGIHVHDTYGESIPSMVKAVEAAEKHDMPIELDGLPSAASGWVSHPDYMLLNDILEAHPNPAIANAAEDARLSQEAIDADEPHIYELNSHYSHITLRYTPENFEAAYNAAVPGGASGTLRGIPGLESNLKAQLKTDDWDEIQRAVFQKVAEVAPDMGYPTMVTPYANMMLVQAAFCIIGERQNNNQWSVWSQDTVDFLLGRLGEEPALANPEIVEIAAKNDKTPEKDRGYTRAKNLPDHREKAREMLIEAGVENPTRREVLTVVTTKESEGGLRKGVEDIIGYRDGTKKPQNKRKRLYDAASNDNSSGPKQLFLDSAKGQNGVTVNHKAIKAVEDMGGHAALERVAQSALMLQLMEDGKRPFPEYAEDLHAQEILRLRSEIAAFIGVENKPEQEGDLSKVFSRMHQSVLCCFLEAKGEGLYQHIMQSVKGNIPPAANVNDAQPDAEAVLTK